MSLATELTRLSNARDKIRNKLIGVELSKPVTSDVVAKALELSIVPTIAGEVATINSDGTGKNRSGGATINIETVLKEGVYTFVYAGTESKNAYIYVAGAQFGSAGGDLNDENDLNWTMPFVSSDEILDQCAGVKIGDTVVIGFSIDASGSDNDFMIKVTHEGSGLIDADSRLDDCADALDAYFTEINAALDEV